MTPPVDRHAGSPAFLRAVSAGLATAAVLVAVVVIALSTNRAVIAVAALAIGAVAPPAACCGALLYLRRKRGSIGTDQLHRPELAEAQRHREASSTGRQAGRSDSTEERGLESAWSRSAVVLVAETLARHAPRRRLRHGPSPFTFLPIAREVVATLLLLPPGRAIARAVLASPPAAGTDSPALGATALDEMRLRALLRKARDGSPGWTDGPTRAQVEQLVHEVLRDRAGVDPPGAFDLGAFDTDDFNP